MNLAIWNTSDTSGRLSAGKRLIAFMACCILMFEADAQIYLILEPDNQPLQYANVVYMLEDSIIGGSYSTERGLVALPSNNLAEKVQVSHVWIRDTTIKYPLTHDTLYLLAYHDVLEEVVIDGGKTESAIIGEKPKSWMSGGVGAREGMELIRLFKNPGESHLLINNVTVYLTIDKLHDLGILKVVFYHNDHGYPGQKLPIERIVEIHNKSARKLEVSLEEEWLVIPDEGLFIGVEWLDNPNDNSSEAEGVFPTLFVRLDQVAKQDQQHLSFIRVRMFNSEWKLLEEYTGENVEGKKPYPIIRVQGTY